MFYDVLWFMSGFVFYAFPFSIFGSELNWQFVVIWYKFPCSLLRIFWVVSISKRSWVQIFLAHVENFLLSCTYVFSEMIWYQKYFRCSSTHCVIFAKIWILLHKIFIFSICWATVTKITFRDNDDWLHQLKYIPMIGFVNPSPHYSATFLSVRPCFCISSI